MATPAEKAAAEKAAAEKAAAEKAGQQQQILQPFGRASMRGLQRYHNGPVVGHGVGGTTSLWMYVTGHSSGELTQTSYWSHLWEEFSLGDVILCITGYPKQPDLSFLVVVRAEHERIEVVEKKLT